MLRRLKAIDWLVIATLVVFGLSFGKLYLLLSVIASVLYLFFRQAGGVFKPKATNDFDDADTFIVEDSFGHEVACIQELELNHDIDYRPAKGRFRWYSRFDLSVSRSDFEYKCDGTKVLIRMLNQFSEGESSGFKTEWEVRDGVVLESDMRARYAAHESRIRDINEDLQDLRKQVEWHELEPDWLNGFKYFVIKRCLPTDEARRYLRQEIERLKLGYAKALAAAPKYNLEPDSRPESFNGWRRVEGKEDLDTTPFWNAVKAGAYGVSSTECGLHGLKMIAQLQKLLGDEVPAAPVTAA